MSEMKAHFKDDIDENIIENEINCLSDEIDNISKENHELSIALKQQIENNSINTNLCTSEYISKLLEIENKSKDGIFQMSEYVKDVKNRKLLNSYSSVFSSINSIFNISQKNFNFLNKKIRSFDKKSHKLSSNESSLSEKIKNNSSIKIYIVNENDYVENITKNQNALTLDDILTIITDKQDKYFSASILKYDHLYNVVDQFSLFKIKKLACNYFRVKDTDYLLINLCGELANLDGIIYSEIKKINMDLHNIDSTDKFYLMSEEIITSEKFKYALVNNDLFYQIIGIRYNMITLYNPYIKCKIILKSNN